MAQDPVPFPSSQNKTTIHKKDMYWIIFLHFLCQVMFKHPTKLPSIEATDPYNEHEKKTASAKPYAGFLAIWALEKLGKQKRKLHVETET